jgi:hypothetical protein
MMSVMIPTPRRYFYDCEFIEDGRTIELVSIGVVDEYGREFYAISTEFDPSAAVPWVKRHVLDRLPSPGHPAWKSRARIRDELYAFLVGPLRGGPMELWAWFAAYDHVVLAQLWGRMPDLPREIPRFTKDLRQLWDDRGRPVLPQSVEQRHDALVDARHNLARWQVLSADHSEPQVPLGAAGDTAVPGAPAREPAAAPDP